MKLYKPFRIAFFLKSLVITLLTLCLSPANSFSKGDPYDITFNNNADADGGSISIAIGLVGPNGLKSTIPVVFNVSGGMTAAQKAQKLKDILSTSKHVTTTCNGTTVNVEVKNNSGFDNISGINISEHGTGEGITDLNTNSSTTPSKYYFNLEGNGTTLNAKADFQISDTLPIISVSTLGKSSTQIELELKTQFDTTTAYSLYTMDYGCGGLIVDNVNADIGLNAGSTDGGLDWSLAIFDTASDCFPYPVDLGVDSLLSPLSCTLLDIELLTVEISNNFNLSLTGFTISVLISGPVNIGPATFTISDTIPPLESATVTLPTPVDLSAPGGYTVQIVVSDSSDQNGTNDTAQFAVVNSTPISISRIITNQSNLENIDGSIDVTAFGGNLPYLFNWSTGSSSEDLLNLEFGEYMLTVTDTNGCTAIDTYFVDIDSTSGEDIFMSSFPFIIGPGDTLMLNGPTKITRGQRFINDDGLLEIPTEITSICMSAYHPFLGKVSVKVGSKHGLDSAKGFIRQKAGSKKLFDADSEFNVIPRFDVEAFGASGCSEDTVKLTAVISAIPPCGETYFAGVQTIILQDCCTGEFDTTQVHLKHEVTCETMALPEPINTKSIIQLSGVSEPGFIIFELIKEADCSDPDNIVLSSDTVYYPAHTTATNIARGLRDSLLANKMPTCPIKIHALGANLIIETDLPDTLMCCLKGSDLDPNGELLESVPIHNDSIIYSKSEAAEEEVFINLDCVCYPCDKLISSVAGSDVSVPGASDGSANLSVSGGEPPYIYLWSNGATSEDISFLSAGIYTVTIADQVLCTVIDTVQIGENDSCNAVPNNAATINVDFFEATLTWDIIPNSLGYQVQGGLLGQNPNTYVDFNLPGETNNSLFVSGLDIGSDYEWQVRAACLDAQQNIIFSEWTPLVIFSTLSCDPPNPSTTTNVSQTTALLNWTAQPNSIGYIVRGAPQGSSSSVVTLYINGGGANSLPASGLVSGITYNWVVTNVCSVSPYIESTFGSSDLNTFTTNSSATSSSETFCDSIVSHFGGDPDSEIKLTIANLHSTSMKVEIESTNADPVDALIIVNGSGATNISPENLSVPGKISRTLTWNLPPSTVDLNVLWSKVSFGGNWQLSLSDITVNFTDTCSDSSGCTDPLALNFDPSAYIDDGSCQYMIEFYVDMRCSGENFTSVSVTGPFCGWCAAGYELSDPDNDSIYYGIFTLTPPVEYKYMVDAWASQENLADDMQSGGSCAPITDFFSFANRQTTSTIVNDTYGSCNPCPSPKHSRQFVKPLISIYPNPFDDRFYIDVKNASGKVELKIFDNAGKEISHIGYTLANSPEEIDLSGISPGIYIVKLNLGADIYIEKLVKWRK